jgi:DNA-binding NarL/FixJ family response regulator
MNPPIQVAIVDDEPRLRELLALTIGESPGFVCDAIYTNGAEALEGLPQRPADVILMDIEMPGMDGIECVRRLKEVLPGAVVLMLTVHDDPERVFEALKAGALGYILKDTPPARLLQAIAEARAGGAPMTPAIARMVALFFQGLKPKTTRAAPSNLTPRERQVLDCVVRGLQNKEIGVVLGISPETIRNHLRNIYDKLQVRCRAEAVGKYLGS